ncbi:pyridoxine 5'-phosphate synthase, partial [Salmonella enterica subsp. enterica serovar Anatum]|nr:pyridoxine 5'-phosphate synthase [Salmonella enterica subsp. enterica serovar Anatum]
VGAPFIEIHTGCYANAETDAEQAKELARIASAATLAARLGLKKFCECVIFGASLNPCCMRINLARADSKKSASVFPCSLRQAKP